MKKFLALLLTMAMTLSLTACGQKQQEPAASSTPAASSAAPQEVVLTPAYSVDGFEPVDADGNRVTTGRDTTATYAIATASKYEVSQVGAEILEKGGNAIDAAVAMGFALGVCEPFTSGLGGGGLATIRTADGETLFVDFREIAPAAATLDLYVNEDGSDNGSTVTGGLASGIPGEVAGLLYMLENYGTMSREEVMAPAIRIATEGFEVSQYCANAIADAYEKAMEFPEMQSVYWDENGLPYQVGDVITNPDLAKALQKIVDEGKDGFYKGEVAEALVSTVQKYGGVITMEDLASYEPQVLEPVTGTYRGYEIISSAPPSSGGTILIEILNILENFDVGAMDINSTEYIHLFTEAYKLGYTDRAAYMADTAFAEVPLDGLTSKDYAKTIYEQITNESQTWNAGEPGAYEGNSTTAYSVADAEGNIVSVTQTIECFWGCKIAIPGYGFILNDQLHDFDTNPESVNCVEGGKKPLSSMSPTIVLDAEGNAFMSVGSPGGLRIWPTVAQVISNVIDHGMSMQDAIDCARMYERGNADGICYESEGENAITADVVAALEAQGHATTDKGGWNLFFGGCQGILFTDNGIEGGADPRRDGKAIGF